MTTCEYIKQNFAAPLKDISKAWHVLHGTTEQVINCIYNPIFILFFCFFCIFVLVNLCWINSVMLDLHGQKIHPPIKGLLLPTGIKPKLLLQSSWIAGVCHYPDKKASLLALRDEYNGIFPNCSNFPIGSKLL